MGHSHSHTSTVTCHHQHAARGCRYRDWAAQPPPPHSSSSRITAVDQQLMWRIVPRWQHRWQRQLAATCASTCRFWATGGTRGLETDATLTPGTMRWLPSLDLVQADPSAVVPAATTAPAIVLPFRSWTMKIAAVSNHFCRLWFKCSARRRPTTGVCRGAERCQ
jgi:hypothetical protein